MDPTSSEQESPAIACFSRDRLRQYLAGWTDDPSTIEIETHLSRCSTCEQTLTELEHEGDSLLAPLRDPGTPAIEHDPIIVQALDAAKQPTRERDTPHAEQAPVPSPILPSSELGPYQLLEPLGRGGMGMVYLAKHRKLNKTVAIKLLPTNFVGSEAQARFEREILAAGQLKHPSIVMATDAGQAGGVQYLVMEYVDGLDLGRLARARSSISIADVSEIGRQVALGLSFAHAAGMVHRDIKPSNVMLDASGSVKILDFGLVLLDRWDGVSSELTTIGQFLGTLDYMAPEQAERCGAVDYRADLYSLGATLFRLLCGRAPLAAAPNQSPLEKLRLLANHRPPSLKTLCSDAPPALVDLIDRLLATDPNDRPPSAAHVAEQLANFTAGADLGSLLDSARSMEVESPSIAGPSIAYPALLAPKAKATRSNIGHRSNRRWLTAMASLPFLFLAGYVIVLETSKGQLVIDSEVADVQVKILRNGQPIKDLDIQTGSTSTRLTADRYEITIQSPTDGLSIDNDRFLLKSGQTIVARIQSRAPAEKSLTPSPSLQPPSGRQGEGLSFNNSLLPSPSLQPPPSRQGEGQPFNNPLLPSPRLRGDGSGVRGDSSLALQSPTPPAAAQPVYDGKTFDEWLWILKTERNSNISADAYIATKQLVIPARRDEWEDVLFDLMRSSQKLNKSYISDLAERPERNVTRMIDILNMHFREHRALLPELFDQAIIHESPAWNPLWNWLDERLASTDAATSISEDAFIREILPIYRNRGTLGRLDDFFNPARAEPDIQRIRDGLAPRILQYMNRSPKLLNYYFSVVAAVVDTNTPSSHQRAMLESAVKILESEDSSPANCLASLNLMLRLNRYDAIPQAKLTAILDRWLLRAVEQNFEMKVEDPARSQLVESKMILGFPYSLIEYGGIRDIGTARLFVPYLLLHISGIAPDSIPTNALQALSNETKAAHDALRRGLTDYRGRNRRIGIDKYDLTIVTSDGRYGPSSSNSVAHGGGGIAFVLHCWANQLLGTPLTDPFAELELANTQARRPIEPLAGVKGSSDAPQLAEKPPATEEPVYEGKTFDEWFYRMRTERADSERTKIAEAIRALRTPAHDAELDAFLLDMFCSRPESLGAYDYLFLSRSQYHVRTIIECFEKDLPVRRVWLSNFLKLAAEGDDSHWEPLWSWFRDQLSSQGPNKEICEEELKRFFVPDDRRSLSNYVVSEMLGGGPQGSPEWKVAWRVAQDKLAAHLLSLGDASPTFRSEIFQGLVEMTEPDTSDIQKRQLVDQAFANLEDPASTAANQYASLALLFRLRGSELVEAKRLTSTLEQFLSTLARLDLSATVFDPTQYSFPPPDFSNSSGKLAVLKDVSGTARERTLIAFVLHQIGSMKSDQRPIQGLQAIASATKEGHDEFEKYLLDEVTRGGRVGGLVIFNWPDFRKISMRDRKAESSDILNALHFIVHQWTHQLMGTDMPDPIPQLNLSDLPTDAEERWVQFFTSQINKSDHDNNGSLTRDEWNTMNGSFDAFDINGDGTITIGEYYRIRKK